MHFLESLSNAGARCERLYTVIRSGVAERCRGLCVLRRPILVAARPKTFVCDCGFESRRVHGCLSLANVMSCRIEVSASGLFLVQRNPTVCVIVCDTVQQ